MNPLVSVIVPIYKVERYLVRCLDSIVNQTYRNLEIILVEDGSPDNCGAICDDYARLDERIRVIHQENRGLSAARNAGLDIMSGEYLMFVDSDDWISLDAVQVLYDRMMADGSDMVLGGYIKTFDGDGEEVISPQWMEDGCYSPSQLVMGMGERRYVPVSAWGKLYRYAYYKALAPNTELADCGIISDNGKITVNRYIDRFEISQLTGLKINLKAYAIQAGNLSPAEAWDKVK